ncbi:PQ-loop repeat [Trema orientale]|uniref:PQ-loop repeat n=1 Tax=Trema orientale TaxID=63057 RepID=A0A2P5EY20_TREOI|nr:PQ-loop repeat [Trema orientale]
MGNLRLKSSRAVCPTNRHCSKWAIEYLEYCLCSVKDGISLTLGVLSVASWAVAEIPQIITTYKQKSAEGLSVAFLITWIVGDLFNLIGCMLEPATLPTQYYMAVLYTMTTTILFAQTIYYGHIYRRLRHRKIRQEDPNPNQTEVDGKASQNGSDVDVKRVYSIERISGADVSSLPIPLPAYSPTVAPGSEFYYVYVSALKALILLIVCHNVFLYVPFQKDTVAWSARSLSRSHTPTPGSVLAQRMASISPRIRNSLEEPLLGPFVSSTQSESSPQVKPLLSVVPAVTFLGTLNLFFSAFNKNPSLGFVIGVRRNQLQIKGRMLQEHGSGEGTGIAGFLGWGMAAIYMGGRFPQILLNIRKGNADGLNPLMFVFALVGNITYVAR